MLDNCRAGWCTRVRSLKQPRTCLYMSFNFRLSFSRCCASYNEPFCLSTTYDVGLRVICTTDGSKMPILPLGDAV